MSINRSKVFYIIFLVIAAVFIGVALGVSLPTIIENERFQGIYEDGTDGVGYNLNMHSANLTVDNVDYFYLTFYYYDGQEERQGQTSKSFTQSEAANAVMSGSIDIRFNGQGAVEATFDKAFANKAPKLFLFVFAGIALVLAAVGVVGMLTSPKSDAAIERKGIETTGIIEKTVGGLAVGGKQYYAVKVTFDNERGESIVGSTGYKYTAEQKEAFPAGECVQIKYLGKSVKILTSENLNEKVE